MKIIPVSKKYDSKIYVIDEKKLIFKLECQCKDFKFRRIKKIGEFADTKYYAEPCKHLIEGVEYLERHNYVLKKPEELIGSDKLIAELKRKLFERAKNKCEDSICESDILLQVHRKTRGSNGGKYNLKNCIVLCGKCHSDRHVNEFPGRRCN